MKTELTASLRTENTMELTTIDPITHTIIVITLSSAVRSLLSQRQLKNPVMTEMITTPQNISSPVIVSAAAINPKYLNNSPRVVLAELMQSSPVTAITITALWFNTFKNCSIACRQQETRQRQIEAAIFFVSFLFWSTSILTTVTMAARAAAKTNDPKEEVNIHLQAVLRKLRPSILQYQNEQATAIVKTMMQQRMRVKKSQTNIQNTINTDYPALPYPFIFFTSEASTMHRREQNQKIENRTVSMILMTGVMNTPHFSLRKVDATLINTIPIQILSLRQYNKQPYIRRIMMAMMASGMISSTMAAIATPNNSRPVRTIMEQTMHLGMALMRNTQRKLSTTDKAKQTPITPVWLEKFTSIAFISPLWLWTQDAPKPMNNARTTKKKIVQPTSLQCLFQTGSDLHWLDLALQSCSYCWYSGFISGDQIKLRYVPIIQIKIDLVEGFIILFNHDLAQQSKLSKARLISTGMLLLVIPISLNLTSKQQKMKTELTAQDSTENTRELTKSEAMIVITIKTISSSPLNPFPSNQKQLIIPAIPATISIPQNTRRPVITSATQKRSKNLERIPIVVLADSMQLYPVTAITITQLWLRILISASIVLRQHEIRHRQIAAGIFLDSRRLELSTSILTKVMMATRKEAKTMEPKAEVKIHLHDVNKKFLPPTRQYQNEQATAIVKTIMQYKKKPKKSHTRNHRQKRTCSRLLFSPFFDLSSATAIIEFIENIQKAPMPICRITVITGLTKTPHFSVINLAATFMKMIPILICLLRQSNIIPYTRKMIRKARENPKSLKMNPTTANPKSKVMVSTISVYTMVLGMSLMRKIQRRLTTKEIAKQIAIQTM